MPSRLVRFLTPVLLLAGSAASNTASGQNEAALIWQQIRDQAYGKCMADARFGAGTELQENCSCSADVVMSLISDDFKHAIASGTQAQYKGPKLKVGAAGFNAAMVQACPKVGAYLPK